MKEIQFQGQTLSNNCVSACLAMLLNKPVDKVTEEFHSQYWNHELTVDRYLRHHGCLTNVPRSDEVRIYEGSIYLLCVPSLSESGSFHCVLLDWRKPDEPKLFDPAVLSRRKYVWTGELVDPLTQFEITSWVIDCQVVKCPALED